MTPTIIHSMSKGGIHKIMPPRTEVGGLWGSIVGIVLIVMSLSPVRAEPNTESLRQIVQRLQPQLKADATEMDIMFWPSLLTKFPELRQLTVEADRYQTAAVDLVIESAGNRGVVDPTPFSSVSNVVLAAMYGLSPNEYLDFTEQILSRSEDQSVVLNEFVFDSLMRPQHRLTGLFVANYQNPRVRQILEQAKRLWVAQSPSGKVREPNFAKSIDETLTGKTALWLKRQKERYPDQYPNNLEPPIMAVAESPTTENVGTPESPLTTPPAVMVDASRVPQSPPRATATPEVAATLDAEPKSPSTLLWLVGIALIAAIIIGTVVMRRKA